MEDMELPDSSLPIVGASPAHHSKAELSWIYGQIKHMCTWSGTSWWVALLLGLWGAMIGIGNMFQHILFVLRHGYCAWASGRTVAQKQLIIEGLARVIIHQNTELAMQNQKTTQDIAGEPATSADVLIIGNTLEKGKGYPVVVLNTGTRNV